MAGSNLYTKGSVSDSDKVWYHGILGRVEAEQALASLRQDCFLIRESRGALVLSLSHQSSIHHIRIRYGPGWYELEKGSAQYSFTELDDLVLHYSNNMISVDLAAKLGLACEKQESAIGEPRVSEIQMHI